MPLYEYQCNECGPFSAIRKMSESHLAAVCENCGSAGERVISAPNFALLDKGRRQAHERNEKSAHEPRTLQRSRCGCAGAHTCSPAGKPLPNKGQGAATGLQMQSKRTARPWMLGH